MSNYDIANMGREELAAALAAEIDRKKAVLASLVRLKNEFSLMDFKNGAEWAIDAMGIIADELFDRPAADKVRGQMKPLLVAALPQALEVLKTKMEAR